MEVERSKRMRIDVDKLPMKRLHAIDEIGNEQFPPDKSNEEQRLSAIHRIDFSVLVEKENEKEKEKNEKELSKSKDGQQQTWQGLMENLRQAQHELSVILDLISTVEANDMVAVAGMQRPKPLPNEALADFAVSAATKVQCLRHLGKYFKQSSKAMEQQVSMEARFYGSLIRLQQNWKVKRQRVGGNEGFTFDLFDSSFSSASDATAMTRPSHMSTISIDRDTSGMLAIHLPQKSYRTLSLRFLGDDDSSTCRIKGNTSEKKASSSGSGMAWQSTSKESPMDEDVNSCIETTHSILRDIHRSLFEEKVFDMVNREAYNSQSSQGINVTGMRQDLLQLVIGQDNSLCISLVLSEAERENKEKGKDNSYNEDSSEMFSSSALVPISLPTDDKNGPSRSSSKLALSSNPVLSLQIYLQSIFHQEVLLKAKEGRGSSGSLLAHFCMTAAHRVFSNKVLSILENLVSRVPYVELVSLPTWHSRTSSWNLRLKVPEASSVVDGGSQKQTRRSQFLTNVVIKDGQISLRGQSSATVVASFTGDAAEPHSVNAYSCDLEDFPMFILHQVASQVIQWLHEEALVVGMKTSMDMLCLKMNLEQGDILSLLARVDPDDTSACISWVLAMLPSGTEDAVTFSFNQTDSESTRLKSLGSLSLESLYSVLMDLANICGDSTI